MKLALIVLVAFSLILLACEGGGEEEDVIVIPHPGWGSFAPDGMEIISSCVPSFDGPTKLQSGSELVCLMPAMTLRLKANFEPDLYYVITNERDWVRSDDDTNPREAHFEGSSPHPTPQYRFQRLGGVRFSDHTTHYFTVSYGTGSNGWTFVSVDYL